MKKLLFTLLFFFQIAHAQHMALGIQVNSIFSQNSPHTRDKYEFGKFHYAPKVHVYDLGLFVERYTEKNYVRFAANLWVSKQKQNNFLQFYDNDSSSQKIAFNDLQFANRFAIEFGKVWKPAPRIQFRGGLLGSFSFSYPKESRIEIEFFENGNFVQRWEINTPTGSAKNAILALSLRVDYSLSSRIQLGLAIQHGLWLAFSDEISERTTKKFDPAGTLFKEFTEVNPAKNVQFQTTGAILPKITIGYVIGKK